MNESLRTLIDISDISCPDSCNQPDKGCHFRAGPEQFTCTKCQLRIRRNFLGYELSATDLNEMLHGKKVTSDEKTLRGKNQTDFRAKLVLNERYEVQLASRPTGKEITEEICPKCGKAKLCLITKFDGSKFYGCSGYPACKFSRNYVPHLFNRTAVDLEASNAKPVLPTQVAAPPATGESPEPAKPTPKSELPVAPTIAPVVSEPAPETQTEAPTPPANEPIVIQDIASGAILTNSGAPEETGIPNEDYSDKQVTVSAEPETEMPPEAITTTEQPKEKETLPDYKRIPTFVKELLQLTEEGLASPEQSIGTKSIAPVEPGAKLGTSQPWEPPQPSSRAEEIFFENEQRRLERAVPGPTIF
jgi:ssDNA-binding Zn-finger/Zn-ribbon topoisomerase 1